MNRAVEINPVTSFSGVHLKIEIGVTPELLYLEVKPIPNVPTGVYPRVCTRVIIGYTPGVTQGYTEQPATDVTKATTWGGCRPGSYDLWCAPPLRPVKPNTINTPEIKKLSTCRYSVKNTAGHQNYQTLHQKSPIA